MAPAPRSTERTSEVRRLLRFVIGSVGIGLMIACGGRVDSLLIRRSLVLERG